MNERGTSISNNNMVGRGASEPNACGDYVRPSDGQRSLKQESDFAERQFYQDIYQKQRTATGARYKRGHLNKGGYVLPTDRMSDAQIQKQNGEVVSANMNTPMTWQQFQVLSNGPSGSKAMYIRFLKDTFQANAGMIASMFGINAVTLSKHIKEDHLNISFPRGGRPS